MTPRQITRAWRRLWGSVAFRLTFNYSLLAASTTIIVLLFVYIQIVNLLQIQFSRQVSVAAHRLVVIYENEGATALASAISHLLSDQTDIDSEMYLLLNQQGEKVAGNLDTLTLTSVVTLASGPAAESVWRDGVRSEGFLHVQRLDNGWVLVVGHDVRELQEIKRLIAQAILVTTFIALLLVMAGTYVFRLALTWRIQDIRVTARDVGTSELTRRVPDHQDEDEFAGLRQDINQMLDRIEVLMSGVRNVSDSIAHNLRTPLARVLAILDTAQQRRLDGSALEQSLDDASREILDLISVTEKLLLIAEAESGVRRQSFRKLALSQIIEDVIDLFEPLASENDIALTLSCDTASQVWADADLLAGAIVNIMENSLKYAGNGARISIHAYRESRHVTLTIEDNGPGVESHHMSRIGTRFYRTCLQAPGYGLGLASVQAIVCLHEGQVWFEDAAPGFRVRIQLPSAES